MYKRDRYGQIILTERGNRAALILVAALLLLYAWLEGTVGLS